MPLTPEDVSNKRFTAVRLREGYDMSEVDQFLDEVESELERLNRENDELRTKLEAAQTGAPAPAVEKAPEPEVAAPVVEKAPEPEPVVEKAPEPVAAVAGRETLTVTTTAEASAAATRLLELAAKNADELVGEAQAQAEALVSEAQANAERLDTESRTKAERLESDARTRAQMLDAETAERRQQLFGDLEKEKSNLDAEIEGLRNFEREYRSQLKSYFHQQLEALEGSAVGTSLGEETPRRLKSIMGEEGGEG